MTSYILKIYIFQFHVIKVLPFLFIILIVIVFYIFAGIDRHIFKEGFPGPVDVAVTESEVFWLGYGAKKVFWSNKFDGSLTKRFILGNVIYVHYIHYINFIYIYTYVHTCISVCVCVRVK